MTLELVQLLKDSRQATMEEWAKEQYIADTGERTLQANAKALGGIDLLDKVLETLESYRPVEITSDNVEKGAHNDTTSY